MNLTEVWAQTRAVASHGDTQAEHTHATRDPAKECNYRVLMIIRVPVEPRVAPGEAPGSRVAWNLHKRGNQHAAHVV